MANSMADTARQGPGAQSASDVWVPSNAEIERLLAGMNTTRGAFTVVFGPPGCSDWNASCDAFRAWVRRFELAPGSTLDDLRHYILSDGRTASRLPS